MNNVVYGRTMKNLKNKTDIRLASNEKDHLKGVSKPSYKSQKCLTKIWLQFIITKLRSDSTKQQMLEYVH